MPFPSPYFAGNKRWWTQERVLAALSKVAAELLLRAPKRTHKSWPTDLGDYYHRYGLRRSNIDGKVKVVSS